MTDKKPLLTRLVTWLRDRLGFEVTELGEDREEHVPREKSERKKEKP